MVGVSQSGGSPDLVQSLEVARQQGALTLAITNQPGSPLARAAELEIDVMAGTERAVAATKSYTAQLLALYLIVDRLRGGDGSSADGLPGLAEQVIMERHQWRELAAALPVRVPPGHHGPRLLVRDRPRGRAQADGDLLRRCAGVLGRRSAARPAGHDRSAGAGADRGRPRGRRRGDAAGAATAGRGRSRRVLRRVARRGGRPPRSGSRCRRASARSSRRCWRSSRSSSWPCTWRWPGAATRMPRAG